MSRSQHTVSGPQMVTYSGHRHHLRGRRVRQHGDLAACDLTDTKGAQWYDFSALADIIVATSAVASWVPISFVLQDQVLLSVWACKDIHEDQVATP